MCTLSSFNTKFYFSRNKILNWTKTLSSFAFCCLLKIARRCSHYAVFILLIEARDILTSYWFAKPHSSHRQCDIHYLTVEIFNYKTWSTKLALNMIVETDTWPIQCSPFSDLTCLKDRCTQTGKGCRALDHDGLIIKTQK